MATKKTKSTARFSARYGLRVRKKVLNVELIQKSKHVCPFCKKKGSVKRLASGIFYCKKCGKKFTGGAYYP